MRLACFQHVPFEGPAGVARWARACGHKLIVYRLDKGDLLPSPDDFDAWVVMGGPMGVYDEAEYPWLRAEKAAIRAAIDAKKGVLGICLGAQLIACVLGAEVSKNPEREIGFFPIDLLPAVPASPIFQHFPDRALVLHWHGDTFAIPKGATLIAKSAACAHQAFVWGDRVIGLQFHLESSAQELEAFLSACRRDLDSGPFVQSAEAMRRALSTASSMESLLNGLLTAWEVVCKR